MEVYERLSKTKTTAPDEVLMRFGRAAKAAGHPEKATEAYSRLVYEFPFSDLAPLASGELENLPVAPIAPGSTRFKLELGRAERLFGAKRYAQARPVFEALRSAARDDDREVVQLRHRRVRLLPEARAQRARRRQAVHRQGRAAGRGAVLLRRRDPRARRPGRIPPRRPAHRRRVPDPELGGRSAEQPRDALHPAERRRERGEDVPRDVPEVSDRALRRARGVEDRLVGVPATGTTPRPCACSKARRRTSRVPTTVRRGSTGRRARTRRCASRRSPRRATRWSPTDYLNSYYGRLAEQAARHGAAAESPPAEGSRIPNLADATTFRARRRCRRTRRWCATLLSLELYDQALDELHYAQKVWGDSPAIQATIGWIYYRRGELRAGINVMKRAYPQYMAAGGEKLPPELLKVLFPINYWPLIKRYSNEHQLDPVRRRRADRAGVDLHRGREVGGERLRPDAAAAVDRPAVRASSCTCRSSRSAC